MNVSLGCQVGSPWSCQQHMIQILNCVVVNVPVRIAPDVCQWGFMSAGEKSNLLGSGLLLARFRLLSALLCAVSQNLDFLDVLVCLSPDVLVCSHVYLQMEAACLLCSLRLYMSKQISFSALLGLVVLLRCMLTSQA